MSNEISNTELFQHWATGDVQAADEIFDRYAKRTWALAEKLISDRMKPRFDGDDIVQSVFRTFLRRSRDGELDMPASDTMWRLLAAVTRNKVRRQVAHHRMQRRDANREIAVADSPAELVNAMASDSEPTADDAAVLIDEVQAVLGTVSPREAEVFRLCLEGHSAPEIAQLTGCSRWTVRRVLDRLGEELQRRLQ